MGTMYYKEGHGEQITYGHLIANNVHLIEVLPFSEKLLFFSENIIKRYLAMPY